MSRTDPNDRHPPPPGGLVRIARYGNADDAELDAMELRARGFEASVLGGNYASLNEFHQGYHQVELLVPEAQAERAREFLRAAAKSPEPPEQSEEEQGNADEKGRPLVVAAEFEDVRQLRTAETALGAADIACVSAARSSDGPRYVLRVAEPDLDAALQALADEADDSADDPQCPQCGSWRIHAVSSFFAEIASAFRGEQRPRSMQCLACKYRGPAEEFWPASGESSDAE